MLERPEDATHDLAPRPDFIGQCLMRGLDRVRVLKEARREQLDGFVEMPAQSDGELTERRVGAQERASLDGGPVAMSQVALSKCKCLPVNRSL